MADNGLKPSLSQVSQTSDSDSSENHTGSSTTLPSGGSGGSAIGSLGTTRVAGYISSTGSIKNKRQPSEMEGYILVSPDLGGNNNNNNTNNNNTTTNDQQSDMVTIPGPKRQRGRPPVSKNQPKPPIFISQQNGPILIILTPGTDVVEGLINFAHSRHVGISILSGVGPVSDVVIRHPVSSAVPNHPIQGPIHMISLTGTYLGGHFVPPLPLPPPLSPKLPLISPSWPACSCFSVLLSGTDGQVFGGVVGGKILAAGTVMVMALLLRNPEIQRSHLINDNGGRDDDDEGGDGGGDDDDDAPFSSVVINSVKVIAAAGGGDGDSSGAIIHSNKCIAGGVNLNFLPNIATAYGAVGSNLLINYQLVPVSAGANVCNVSMIQ